MRCSMTADNGEVLRSLAKAQDLNSLAALAIKLESDQQQLECETTNSQNTEEAMHGSQDTEGLATGEDEQDKPVRSRDTLPPSPPLRPDNNGLVRAHAPIARRAALDSSAFTLRPSNLGRPSVEQAHNDVAAKFSMLGRSPGEVGQRGQDASQGPPQQRSPLQSNSNSAFASVVNKPLPGLFTDTPPDVKPLVMGRKRKNSAPVSLGSTLSLEVGSSGDLDQKLQMRREKNRLAARKCRQKKMQVLVDMERQVQGLLLQNQQMYGQLITLQTMFRRMIGSSEQEDML